MATAKQRKAIENMVENGGIVSKAMIDAGYSPNTAHSPSKLTDSKGFNELFDEYGLTDELIVTALVDDIKNKPKRRLPELALAAKMKGLAIDRTDLTTNGKELPSPIIPVDVLRDNSNSEDSTA